MQIRSLRSTGSLILPALFCTSCLHQPEFVRPEDLGVKRYAIVPSTPTADYMGPNLQIGAALPKQWWEIFQSAQLNELVTRALANSPTLRSAEYTLKQAQEQASATIGSLYFPQFDLSAGANRYSLRDVTTDRKCLGANLGAGCPGEGAGMNFPGIPTSRLPNVFTLANATLNVAYQFDLFGGNRQQVASARAGVEYQEHQLRAAHLTLVSNITAMALREGSLRAQAGAIARIIELFSERIEILRAQIPLGGASEKDLDDQISQLEQTRARLPSIQKDLEATRSQLAVYAGQMPVEELPIFDLADFQTPTDLPLSLPSQLVARRPDIRAAESLLRQAAAEVGVATANLFPQINLNIGFGPYLLEANPFIGLHAALLSLGASLMQPVFHGGELVAKRRAALAAYESNAANYWDTVLTGFKQVGDSLYALQGDSQAVASYEKATLKSGSILNITQKQQALGALNRLSVLDAEREYQEVKASLASIKGSQLSDIVALFQALGGGWWEQPEPLYQAGT